MKKVYYIGYISDYHGAEKRYSSPAANMKASYIISTLNCLGFDVEVLSCSVPNDHENIWKKYRGYCKTINNVQVRFFDAYCSKNRLLRVIGKNILWHKIHKYIKNNCIGKEDDIVIYHSLAFLKLMRYLKTKKKPFILEVEEIYADVIDNQRIRKQEIAAVKSATGYIFPTLFLDNEVNSLNKPSVIVHGTYQIEPDKSIRLFDREHIHCVYAGTFDPRKGVCEAIAATEFLPQNYFVHIIGFGNDSEIKKIKQLISEVSKKSKAKITYDGLKNGDEYIAFLQSCDIGLSTQDPNASFNETSFPSKILSYLSNGLRVVSIKIPAIEQSAIGSQLYYYDSQTPKSIAETILSINIADSYDSRKMIQTLDLNFKKDITKLFSE